MIQTIFDRVEKKYLLDSNTLIKLLDYMNEHIKEDQYGTYKILNIYYDTKNKDLINASLEKPLYKEKLRLRSYEQPNLNSNVFLEIKKKYKGIVNKRRINISLKEVYEYQSKGYFSNPENHTYQEIDYMFKKYNLKPAVFISYDRKAYIGVNNASLRMTIDTNIRTRNYDLKLENGDYGEKLLQDDKYLVEIKCLYTFPLWLVKILSELKIYPTSFSKYGNTYMKELKGE